MPHDEASFVDGQEAALTDLYDWIVENVEETDEVDAILMYIDDQLGFALDG